MQFVYHDNTRSNSHYSDLLGFTSGPLWGKHCKICWAILQARVVPDA